MVSLTDTNSMQLWSNWTCSLHLHSPCQSPLTLMWCLPGVFVCLCRRDSGSGKEREFDMTVMLIWKRDVFVLEESLFLK